MQRLGIALILVAVVPLGCSHPQPRLSDAVGPLSVTDLMDARLSGDTVSVLIGRPAPTIDPEPSDPTRHPFNVLVLSGGGADGAYSAVVPSAGPSPVHVPSSMLSRA